MTRTRLATIALAILLAGVMVACATGPATVTPKGHEGIEPPTATPGPFPQQHGKPSSRPRIEADPVPSATACTTPQQAVNSAIKASPDSALYRDLKGTAAKAFIEHFNHVSGETAAGDEVLIVTSDDFGPRAIVVFLASGCAKKWAPIDFDQPQTEGNE